MEALQLHPAAQAAADDASMHGAGPMQARFSPYDYNGGSVHCPSPLPLPVRVAEERVARVPRLLCVFFWTSCPRRAPDTTCAVRRTVLAVAGKDFAIVAGDTRCSTGFSIMSRNVSKIYQM